MRRSTHEFRHSHSRVITRWDIRDILVSFNSGLIYRHVSESFEMSWEQVESVEDKTNVLFTLSFSSCLVLSRRECKLGINGWAVSSSQQGFVLHWVQIFLISYKILDFVQNFPQVLSFFKNLWYFSNFLKYQLLLEFCLSYPPS